MPVSYTSARRLASSSYVGSLPTDIGDGAPLTFGGWVRLRESPSTQREELFHNEQASGFFVSAALAVAGCLEVACTTGPSFQVSNVTVQAITDTDWHYVAVSIDITQSPEPIAVFIDGVKCALDAGLAPVPDGALGAFIGYAADSSGDSGLHFASFSVWDRALDDVELAIPLYAAPRPGSRRLNKLVAAYNFADGIGVDTSPSQRPIVAVSPTRHTPSLALSSGSSAAPADTDLVSFGALGGFSLVAWTARDAGTTYTVASCASDEQAFSMTIDDNWVTITRTGQSQQVVFVAPSPGAGWHHVALITPVKSVDLYIDGYLVESFDPSGMENWARPFTGTTVFAGAVGNGAMQALSVWDVCLDTEAIKSYMDGAVPSPGAGLVASYALIDDLANSVTGSSLTLVNAQLADDEGFETGEGPTDVGPARVAVPAVLTEETDHLTLLDFEGWLEVAAQHGVTPGDGHPVEPASADRAAALAALEPLLANAPAATADHLRAQLERHLAISAQLAARGIRTGTFDVEPGTTDTAVYYHAADGRHEVHRFASVLSGKQSKLLEVILAAVAAVFALFGLRAAVKFYTSAAATWFGPVLNLIAAGVQWGSGASAATILAIMKFILAAGRFLAFVRTALANMSFWDRLFAALSFVAQVAACLVGAGWAVVAAKFALLEISLSVLTSDILFYYHEPPEGWTLPPGDAWPASPSQLLRTSAT